MEKISEIKNQMDYERTRKYHQEGCQKLHEIPGKRSTDKQLYHLEIENIFLKSWLIIIREDEVINHGDEKMVNKLVREMSIVR